MKNVWSNREEMPKPKVHCACGGRTQAGYHDLWQHFHTKMHKDYVDTVKIAKAKADAKAKAADVVIANFQRGFAVTMVTSFILLVVGHRH